MKEQEKERTEEWKHLIDGIGKGREEQEQGQQKGQKSTKNIMLEQKKGKSIGRR